MGLDQTHHDLLAVTDFPDIVTKADALASSLGTFETDYAASKAQAIGSGGSGRDWENIASRQQVAVLMASYLRNKALTNPFLAELLEQIKFVDAGCTKITDPATKFTNMLATL